MRRRVNAKPSAQSGGSSSATAAASSRLPDVLPEDRSVTPRAPPPRSSGAAAAPASPKLLFSSFNQANGQTRRTLDLRDKKKLRCIWLAPGEGDQQIVRPPPLDGIHYSYIATSRFGQDVLAKIKRTDTLSVNLEKNGRFMDAVHTYEQSSKMLNRCMQKRSESQDVTVEEIKWLRVDYEIRCVQLVALCMLGARKSDAQADNTPFLLLKKAEELTARDGLHYCKNHVPRSAVYQNIANHYKKQKKYQAALQAAEKAVRINEKLPARDRLPISYFLKACLHGLLNDPSNAGLMYTECLNLSDAQQPAKKAITRGAVSGREDEQTALETFSILKAATLHNMAIEWANLHMPDQCRDALANAMEVGVDCLPQTHPVVLRILDTYKVMRQDFLFKGEPPSETKPAVTRPSPPPSFMGTDDVTPQKPLPPISPSVPVEAEEVSSIIPASAGEEDDTLNPKTSVERSQMVRSDTNERLLGVILSSVVSENVENVVQATIEDVTSAQLDEELRMMSNPANFFNSNAVHLVSDVVSASKSESGWSDVVCVVSGEDPVESSDLENTWNNAEGVWLPPTIVFEQLTGPSSGTSFVEYDGEGISPSNIEKLNSFSRATASWEDRVSHWSPVESSRLASARKSEERSPSNAIAGTSSTSTMKTLWSAVMGRQRSMSEDYLFELIAQCDGGLEDLEDGLSEVYASVFPDEELRDANLPGSQSRSVDWVSGSYGFGKSSRDDMNTNGSANHGGDELGSSSNPRKSDDQSTFDLASVLDEQALTADKETVSGEEIGADDQDYTKTEGNRGPPALGPEIGWDPLNQDRSKVVRNVVTLYVYTTLQYALLEASSRLEEGDHN